MKNYFMGKNIIFWFLMEVNSITFPSQPKISEYRKLDPGYLQLTQDPLFTNTYKVGKAKYEELYHLIQNNSTSSDEEVVICQQYDLTYFFYKKSKIIESLGCGYRIVINPSGKISEIHS